MIDQLLENHKVIGATYLPEQFTFELKVISPGKVVADFALLTKDTFPNHTPFQILDEDVRVHENVKVILKSEAELAYQGWKIQKEKLTSKLSPFKIGKKKKSMLGNLHNVKVGITESFKPFVFVNGYRFSPNEIKCIIKTEDLKAGIDMTQDTSCGKMTFISASPRLVLPRIDFRNANEINEVISFLRKAQLI